MSALASHIMEVIEPEGVIFNSINRRCQDIQKYDYFGPPDMCYLLKEMKGGLLSSPTRAGFFHYVYGVDASSSASVAAYIKSIIQKQETISQDILIVISIHRKLKITKATFCMFDVVLRRDVRVEISIPGGTHVFAMDENQARHPITGVEWNYVFMSSLLRSFEPKPCPAFRIIQELGTQELYNDFFLVANNLFKSDVRFGELLDTAKQGSNLMIQKITEYLIKKKRIADCLTFLLPLQNEDPLIATHISDALISIDKNKETILLLAEKIREYPYLVPLLLKQALAFIKSEFYEYALKLSKICVDLCPESFETWFQLAEVYYYMKKIKMSLIALDIGPQYPDVDYVSRVQLIQDYEISKPKIKKTTDMHPYLMIEPFVVDFRKQNEDSQSLLTQFQRGDLLPFNIHDLSKDEQDMLKKLLKVNSIQLTQCEKRCYDLLVKIEKDISWETLLKIKRATFLVESDNEQWVNPFFSAQNAKTIDEDKIDKQSKKKGGMTDESFYEIQNQAERFIKQRGKDIKQSKIETIAEEEKSDLDEKDESPSIVQQQKKQKRKDTLLQVTMEDKQVTFVSDQSGEEENNEQDDQSEGDILNEQIQESDSRKKRLCYKLDRLFTLLYEDLNLLCEWENDEKKRGQNDKNLSGIIWIHRGILAERLNRKRLAERAYRNGIEKGFSLYAWSRLLKIYAETYNPKACLVCMAEILDQAEEDGIETYIKFPSWLEEALHDLIANNGIKTILRLIKEMELEDCKPLTDAIQKAYHLKVEGHDQ